MQLQAWMKLIEADDPIVQDFARGPSPGGAAAELGVTRQTVHNAIQRGDLDALAVYRGAKLSHYTISLSSLRRYKAYLATRRRA